MPRVQVNPNLQQDQTGAIQAPVSTFVMPNVRSPGASPLVELAGAFNKLAGVGGRILQRQTEQAIGAEALARVDELEMERSANVEQFKAKVKSGEIEWGQNPWVSSLARRTFYHNLASEADQKFREARSTGELGSFTSVDEAENAYHTFTSEYFRDSTGIPFDMDDSDIAVSYGARSAGFRQRFGEQFSDEVIKKNEANALETVSIAITQELSNIDPAVGVTDEIAMGIEAHMMNLEAVGLPNTEVNDFTLATVLGGAQNLIRDIDYSNPEGSAFRNLDKAQEMVQALYRVQAGPTSLGDRPAYAKAIDATMMQIDDARNNLIKGANEAHKRAQETTIDEYKRAVTGAFKAGNTEALIGFQNDAFNLYQSGKITSNTYETIRKYDLTFRDTETDLRDTQVVAQRGQEYNVDGRVNHALLSSPNIHAFREALSGMALTVDEENKAIADFTQVQDTGVKAIYEDANRLIYGMLRSQSGITDRDTSLDMVKAHTVRTMVEGVILAEMSNLGDEFNTFDLKARLPQIVETQMNQFDFANKQADPNAKRGDPKVTPRSAWEAAAKDLAKQQEEVSVAQQEFMIDSAAYEKKTEGVLKSLANKDPSTTQAVSYIADTDSVITETGKILRDYGTSVGHLPPEQQQAAQERVNQIQSITSDLTYLRNAMAEAFTTNASPVADVWIPWNDRNPRVDSGWGIVYPHAVYKGKTFRVPKRTLDLLLELPESVVGNEYMPRTVDQLYGEDATRRPLSSVTDPDEMVVIDVERMNIPRLTHTIAAYISQLTNEHLLEIKPTPTKSE